MKRRVTARYQLVDLESSQPIKTQDIKTRVRELKIEAAKITQVERIILAAITTGKKSDKPTRLAGSRVGVNRVEDTIERGASAGFNHGSVSHNG